MAHVMLPGTIEGTFLLGASDFRDLDALLDSAKKEMTSFANDRLSQAVEQEFRSAPELGRPAKDKSELRKELKEDYPHSQKSQEVCITCASDKRVKETSFEKLISSRELTLEMPISVSARMQVGEAELSLDFPTRRWNDNEVIEVTVTPSESPFAHRIVRSFVEWGEEHGELRWWRRIKSWGFLQYWMCVLCLLLLGVALKTTSSEKTSLIEAGKALSHKGINSSNQSEAIDVLLRLATEDYKGSEVVGIHGWYILLVICVGLAVPMALLCPRSIIGMGLGARKLRRARTIVAIVRGVLVLLVLAVLSSAIGSWIYELVKNG